ncbi:MAG TPA: GAF domain-containing protein, partial [Candidatus Acidoferrum sp.]|nr:GAF domain-containing protein [Candidatus Acidoferrum sp.]
MAEWGRIGDLDAFAEQVAAACRRRDSLEGRASDGEQTSRVAGETLTELGTALEELRVAVEELQQQNRQLTTARQDLAAEYQRYQELFEGIPDGYLATDADGCIRKTNRIAGALLGMDPRTLVGKPLVLFLAPEDRRDFYAHLTAVVAGGPADEWAVIVVPRGGAPFAASLTVMPLTGGGPGRSPGLRWLLRDLIRTGPAVGGAGRPATKVAELSDEGTTEPEAGFREGPGTEATPTGRISQLEALLTAAAEITHETDLARLLELISLVMAGILGVGAGTVYLWDEAAQLLIPHGRPGFGAGRKGIRLRLGEDVAGAVAKRRAGLLVNEYRTSVYALSILLEQSDATAVLAEPLVYRDRLLGVLTADNSGTGRPFTERDRETLALFAPQAAVVIQNARLFEECRQKRGDLREMAVHLMGAEEGERLRLAEDLHDLAVQNLAVVSLNLGLALGQLPKTLQSMTRFWLQESLMLVGKMSDRVRSLMENLRPSALDDSGLIAALRWYGGRMTDWAGLRVEVRGEEPVPRLSAPAEDTLSR